MESFGLFKDKNNGWELLLSINAFCLALIFMLFLLVSDFCNSILGKNFILVPQVIETYSFRLLIDFRFGKGLNTNFLKKGTLYAVLYLEVLCLIGGIGTFFVDLIFNFF